jgi:hypothetical protein
MEEIKLKKSADEVRQVLEHYLTTGQKFTDTPDADPGLADYEVKFKKWSADAAASTHRCFDPPAVTERFLRVPRRKGIWRELKIVTRYRNLLHAYEYQCDYIKELKGTMGIYESPISPRSPTSNTFEHESLADPTELSPAQQQVLPANENTTWPCLIQVKIELMWTLLLTPFAGSPCECSTTALRKRIY